MENKLFKLAWLIRKLRDEKARLDDDLKFVNNELNKAQQELFEAMEAAKVSNFTYDGRQYVQQRSVYASPAADCNAAVYEWLRVHGLGDIVTETVNAKTFAALVREQIGDMAAVMGGPLPEDAEDLSPADRERLLVELALPDGLRGLVNVAIKKQVQMRKAGK